MKKDCSKVISTSILSERLKSLLGGGFVAKASLRIGCEIFVWDSCFSKVKLMTNTFLC